MTQDRKAFIKRRFGVEVDERTAAPFRRRIQMLNDALKNELTKNDELCFLVQFRDEKIAYLKDLIEFQNKLYQDAQEKLLRATLETGYLEDRVEVQMNPRWCLKRIWEVIKS